MSTTETFEYVCKGCHQTFTGTREADERAHAEAKRLFGRDGHAPDMDIVCDDCFQSMKRGGYLPEGIQ